MEPSVAPFVGTLATGELGITLDVRQGPLRHVSHAPRGCLLEDPRTQVRVHVGYSPTRLHLGLDHWEQLERDVRHEASLEMEAAHADMGRSPSSGVDPVLELERMDVGGSPALRVLRRLHYGPGRETVLHDLALPLPDGTLRIQVIAQSRVTGLREALAVLKKLGARGLAGAQPPNRSELDGADHDPLGLARAALPDFLGAYAIMRSAPPPTEPVGEVELEGPRCAVVPPPRHLHANLPMSPTLAFFLSRAALTGGYRHFEVWRLPDPLRPGRGAASRLAKLARASNLAWANEGAIVEATAPREVDSLGGRPQVADEVRMRAGNRPSVVCQRWFVEPDGVVFRLSTSGPPPIARELDADLEAALPTWRRLDDVGEPPRRRWFR